MVDGLVSIASDAAMSAGSVGQGIGVDTEAGGEILVTGDIGVGPWVLGGVVRPFEEVVVRSWDGRDLGSITSVVDGLW